MLPHTYTQSKTQTLLFWRWPRPAPIKVTQLTKSSKPHDYLNSHNFSKTQWRSKGMKCKLTTRISSQAPCNKGREASNTRQQKLLALQLHSWPCQKPTALLQGRPWGLFSVCLFWFFGLFYFFLRLAANPYYRITFPHRRHQRPGAPSPTPAAPSDPGNDPPSPRTSPTGWVTTICRDTPF